MCTKKEEKNEVREKFVDIHNFIENQNLIDNLNHVSSVKSCNKSEIFPHLNETQSKLKEQVTPPNADKEEDPVSIFNNIRKKNTNRAIIYQYKFFRKEI